MDKEKKIHTSLSPITKKGALDSQAQEIKFTSCLPMVGGSLRALQLLSSTTKTGRHDIAEILLKVALKHQKSIKSNHEHKFNKGCGYSVPRAPVINTRYV